MAIVEEGSPLSRMTGKIGSDLYIRHVNGKAVIQQCPARKRVKIGPEMPKTNLNFRYAASYASAVRKNDPELTALYANQAEGFNSASTMAISDYLTLPVVKSIERGKPPKAPRNVIMIRVENVVRVMSVMVGIEDANGVAVEKGMAEITADQTLWRYRCLKPLPRRGKRRVLVTVLDFPGHTVNAEVAF